jgi:hypothetical protein
MWADSKFPFTATPFIQDKTSEVILSMWFCPKDTGTFLHLGMEIGCIE